ncbi:testis-expressed protein 9 [Drosophila erecta]|uniref:Testis-expressed sequence 9 protein n=1 Tax=Drosophila erecta TaxID=7220 RepID=B3NQU8_DROER|nr:testis-expressed protein 9 [Drosophila erecta]EDV57031.1 uncharacterized protein Dere_GG19914 [Drosophila erecta]
MAELLSREKELFKINQELNLLTLSPAAEAMYPAKGLPGSTAVTLPRYATFQKQKGPSSLLRKKGVPTAPTKTAPKTSPGRDVVPTARSPLPDTNTLTKSKPAAGPTSPAARTMSKFSTFTRDVSSKTATLVKYRNPNFSESPSLDELLRVDAEEAARKQDVVEVEVTEKRESTTVVNGQLKKQVTKDNFIKFLKAKVAILEEDHAHHAGELTRQKEQLELALEAHRKSENQRDQTISSNKHLSEQLMRAERQCEDANRRQKERQLEFITQQRELEQLKRDAKVSRQTTINLENRLSRVQEDADAARQELKLLREEQRDQLEAHRKELKLRDSRIRALKRQRGDLLNAYKKQLYMIDNLKRQTSCLEQSAAIGFGEKEFNKVLDWNAKT